MGDRYGADVLEWSECQARLLRQHVAGEAGYEAPDWAKIIEEIESLGRSQIDAVASWWRQAFLYDLKAAAWPLLRDVPVWQGKAFGLRAQARDKYRPSMRQRLDVAGLYADALSALPGTIEGQPPLPVPTACPVTLDELLGGEL